MFTVSELSEHARTPVSSIKYYLREALLQPGNLEAEHRAFYDHAHVRRLLLIQALRDVAGLPIPAIRDICKQLDGERGRDLARVVGCVIDALGRREAGSAPAHARREVVRMLAANGVHVRRHAKSVTDLADALVGLRQVLGTELPASVFEPYLDAMCRLATRDFKANKHLVSDASSAAFGATLATVLWEPILLLLRRIAFEHVAVKTFHPRKPRRG
jgi:DNA-binding transcriptional MerR regulator